MSQEVRDKLAVLEGWQEIDGVWYEKDVGQVYRLASMDDGGFHCHPIPDDLNTCAAMWDKYADGLIACMHVEFLTARTRGRKGVAAVRRTGTNAASELRDRWALLGEVLKARGVW